MQDNELEVLKLVGENKSINKLFNQAYRNNSLISDPIQLNL